MAGGTKKLLFITVANLTTNPRLLKELKLLQQDYQCYFVGFRLGNWSDVLEKLHQEELPNVHFHYLSATRYPFLIWLWSSIINTFTRRFFYFKKKSVKISAYASDKRAYMLNNYLFRHRNNYDLVIAHNLGALFPVWNFCTKNSIPFSFDVEDYHPGEKITIDTKNEQHRREYLLKQILPEASYISYASPLIGKKSIDLVDKNKMNNHVLINNSFYSVEFVSPREVKGKLKLVWFSQYVDVGRGLEKFLPILDRYQEKVELHLIGNPRTNFIQQYLNDRKYIRLHGTMTQQELHGTLSKFDIGLALESIEQDQNRDICLTNKIWAYTQAGLFVVATNTSAQKQFINKNPWVGLIVEQKKVEIASKVSWLLDNIDNIRKEKLSRFEMAKDLSWEKEGEKLKKVIADILK